jgi:hypothetical protein
VEGGSGINMDSQNDAMGFCAGHLELPLFLDGGASGTMCNKAQFGSKYSLTGIIRSVRYLVLLRRYYIY